MGRVPLDVMQHQLDTTWQAIFTFASWAIVALMLAAAVRMGLRQRTPFYVFAILAAGVAAFAEPLYDVTFDLWFYDADAAGKGGAMWSTFSAFGIIQPNWTHSGYVILYTSACLYAGKRMYDGRLSRTGLFAVWGVEMLASIVFEVIGTGTDVYTYYGPYVLRIGNYPAVIGVLEATQVVLFTTLAVQLWRRVRTNWGLSALLIAFPITMFGANFGIGSPLIIALHLDGGDFSKGLVYVATFLTMGLCALAVRGASLFLPTPPVVDLSERVPADERAAVTV